MSGTRCAVVLLASGLSARFGSGNKLLSELAGKPVIDYVLAAIKPVGFAGHYAVIGAQDTHLKARVISAGFEVVLNPEPKNGQGVSLARGVRAAIGGGHTQICIALADMPMVGAAHYKALLELSQNYERAASQAIIDGHAVTLPPAVFSGRALERLASTSGDIGAKSLLRGEGAGLQKMSSLAAKDIDTQADLQALESLLIEIEAEIAVEIPKKNG